MDCILLLKFNMKKMGARVPMSTQRVTIQRVTVPTSTSFFALIAFFFFGENLL